MNIHDNIREIRTQKGLTQSVISDALHCDLSVVSNMELGKREIKCSELEIIANALGVSVVDLVTWPVKYIPAHSAGDAIRTVLQIELTKDKQDQVLNIVLGEEAARKLKE